MRTSARVLQHLSDTVRVGGGLWLLAYAGVLLAAPLADARQEARSLASRPHIESEGRPECPPVHDHAACPVCRTLRIAKAVPAPAMPAPVLGARCATVPSPVPVTPRAAFIRSPGARAPPLA